jgi:MoxR-like ATPase
MEEYQITVEGKTYKLEKPFFVIATQNPIECHGTFELPEAQLDRFIVVLNLGYPSESEENNILEFYLDKSDENVDPVLSLDDYLKLYQHVRDVKVNQEIRKYILSIVKYTREHPGIRLGVSPRGGLSLLKMSQASAMIRGRNYVIPDDVKNVAVETLSHRIIPLQKRDLLSNNALIAEILSEIEVP